MALTDAQREQLKTLQEMARKERIEKLAESAASKAESFSASMKEKFNQVFDTPEKVTAAKWAMGAMAVVGATSVSPILGAGAAAYGLKILYDKSKETAGAQTPRMLQDMKGVTPGTGVDGSNSIYSAKVNLSAYGQNMYGAIAKDVNPDVANDKSAAVQLFDRGAQALKEGDAQADGHTGKVKQVLRAVG